MVNGKVGHMSDIVLICNKFKNLRRSVGPANTDWTDVMGDEDGFSTSVELGISGHWERFSREIIS